MKFLGIDVGTGGSRALVVDASGRVVASATVEHAPFASPRAGWAEQDARDWWRASREAARAVLASEGVRAEEVACVGLTGQMHGAVLLDEGDEPLRPSIIWRDARTHEQCRALTERVGRERLIRLVSNPALEGFTLPKLLWVREREPEVWARVRRVLLPKDYVRLRLTGERATDVADASGTLLFDVGRRRWSGAMLSLTELDAGLLPRVFESQEVAGRVSKEGAEATGLREGTPVVAGAGDRAAGAVGVGLVRPGAVGATIGASGVVFAATDRPALDPKGRVHTFCHAVPGGWHVMGVTQGAGLSLRWFRDQFGAGADDGRDPYERLADEAALAPPGSDGLLWAPYLMGERTPHLDPHARAALVGLTASHTRAHVVRALMEGVAFSLRDTLTVLEEMGAPVGTIRLGGGGARSPLWRQVQADVYGREVELVEADEGAAYGAALLAGVGAGAWGSVEEACDAAVRVRVRVAPQADAAKVLDERYKAFQKLYPALRGVGQNHPR
ncbi:MAG TPA: xylulokinase [Pyrinomonadaceae bacterium]|jgi:xylulokinase